MLWSNLLFKHFNSSSNRDNGKKNCSFKISVKERIEEKTDSKKAEVNGAGLCVLLRAEGTLL